FVTRADMPAADVARLRQAMLRLGETPAGRDVLKRLHPGLTALVPAQDGDYDTLRAMVRAVDRSSRR
ncbi:MAG: PhnD/SsuA/transferrin family substrate-binding protein, partial [Thiobacillaceae bacterium]